MSIRLISIALIALGALSISLILAFVSAKGLLRLWMVAGCLALITFIGWFKIEFLTIYENWGSLGGIEYGLSLLSVSVAVIVGAGVHSIPDETRKMVWLKIVLAFLLMGLVMFAGLTIWMS
jgi:hypothetical protein